MYLTFLLPNKHTNTNPVYICLCPYQLVCRQLGYRDALEATVSAAHWVGNRHNKTNKHKLGLYFSSVHIQVVCRQLGYRDALEATVSAAHGPGNGRFILDNVQCMGTELNLTDCLHEGFMMHNCQTNEDAGVICQTAGKLLPCVFLWYIIEWCPMGTQCYIALVHNIRNQSTITLSSHRTYIYSDGHISANT